MSIILLFSIPKIRLCFPFPFFPTFSLVQSVPVRKLIQKIKNIPVTSNQRKPSPPDEFLIVKFKLHLYHDDQGSYNFTSNNVTALSQTPLVFSSEAWVPASVGGVAPSVPLQLFAFYQSLQQAIRGHTAAVMPTIWITSSVCVRMCDCACSRACVQTDFPSQIVLPSSSGGSRTASEGQINLRDLWRGDIRYVVSNQKGTQINKQAAGLLLGKWVWEITCSPHDGPTHIHTHISEFLCHSPADRSNRWAAELTLCNLYAAKSAIISAFAPYLIDLAGVWCTLAPSQEGADG